MKHVKLFEGWEEITEKSGLSEGIQNRIDDALRGAKGAWDTVRRLQGLEDEYDYDLSPGDQDLVMKAYNTVFNRLSPKQVDKVEKRQLNIRLLKAYKRGEMTAGDALFALGLDSD